MFEHGLVLPRTDEGLLSIDSALAPQVMDLGSYNTSINRNERQPHRSPVQLRFQTAAMF
jgi:hypothetical protein